MANWTSRKVLQEAQAALPYFDRTVWPLREQARALNRIYRDLTVKAVRANPEYGGIWTIATGPFSQIISDPVRLSLGSLANTVSIRRVNATLTSGERVPVPLLTSAHRLDKIYPHGIGVVITGPESCTFVGTQADWDLVSKLHVFHTRLPVDLGNAALLDANFGGIGDDVWNPLVARLMETFASRMVALGTPAAALDLERLRTEAKEAEGLWLAACVDVGVPDVLQVVEEF